jgi:hypothetical protein
MARVWAGGPHKVVGALLVHLLQQLLLVRVVTYRT